MKCMPKKTWLVALGRQTLVNGSEQRWADAVSRRRPPVSGPRECRRASCCTCLHAARPRMTITLDDASSARSGRLVRDGISKSRRHCCGGN